MSQHQAEHLRVPSLGVIPESCIVTLLVFVCLPLLHSSYKWPSYSCSTCNTSWSRSCKLSRWVPCLCWAPNVGSKPRGKAHSMRVLRH
jgi:hypothetical protein